jgi:hypothetical protein
VLPHGLKRPAPGDALLCAASVEGIWKDREGKR